MKKLAHAIIVAATVLLSSVFVFVSISVVVKALQREDYLVAVLLFGFNLLILGFVALWYAYRNWLEE